VFNWLNKLVGKGDPAQTTPGPAAGETAEAAQDEGGVDEVVEVQEDVDEEPEDTDKNLAASEAPWDLGPCAPSLNHEDLQQDLVKHLEAEWDNAKTQHEREFVEGLMATVWKGEMEIPAFPEAARKLDELLQQGRDPTMMEIVRLVERDPALVQRVWTRASSAEFVVPPKGLHFAVSRIGFDELWRIAIQACMQSALFRVPGFQDAADRVRMFGLVSAEVSSELMGEKRGAAYLAGMLHDVGKLLVYRHTTFDLIASPASAALVERLAVSMHPSFGGLVSQSWQLGDEVAAALGFHHDPFQAPEEYQRMARIVRTANLAVYAVDAERRGMQVNPMPAIKAASQGIINNKHPLEIARRAFDHVQSMM